jgi:hypothetical protein
MLLATMYLCTDTLIKTTVRNKYFYARFIVYYLQHVSAFLTCTQEDIHIIHDQRQQCTHHNPYLRSNKEGKTNKYIIGTTIHVA